MDEVEIANDKPGDGEEGVKVLDLTEKRRCEGVVGRSVNVRNNKGQVGERGLRRGGVGEAVAKDGQ
jgi:hypothetical protein